MSIFRESTVGIESGYEDNSICGKFALGQRKELFHIIARPVNVRR